MQDKPRSRMHEEELGILSLISRQIRQLYQVKLAQEQRKSEEYIAKLLGVPSFVARKLSPLARRCSLDWCRQGILYCGKTDLRMKTTGADGKALLTQLVLDLALS